MNHQLGAVDAAGSASVSPWTDRIASYKDADRNNPQEPGGIVFVGGSMIALWNTMADDLAPFQVINRGLPGATIADFTRLAETLIVPYQPAQIVLYAGSNDLASGMMPRAVFHDYHRFIDTISVALPSALVTYLSIMYCPERWDMREAVRVTNHLISSYTRDRQRAEFINASALVLGDDGNPLDELYVDGLHLNRGGYERLISAIRPNLVA